MHRLVIVGLVALAACSSTPSPLPSGGAATAAVTVAPSVVTPTAAIVIPATGRPYTADQVLAAMRGSRRPGGVPDELETAAVATQLAAAIWTYDGRPYPSLVVGGSCGPATCTLEVNGAPAGAAGTDLYAFSVTRATGAVEAAASDLHGYPAALDALIDGVVRDRLDPASVEGLAMTGAAWQPPPRAGWFLVAYRSGGEEGSPGFDILVDLPAAEIVQTSAP